MKAFGATTPLSAGFLDMWTNRDLKAEARVGGDEGITGACTMCAFCAGVDSEGVRPSVTENFRSGFRGRIVPTPGRGDGGGIARGSGGTDGSGSWSKSSRNGLQKYKTCNTEFA